MTNPERIVIENNLIRSDRVDRIWDIRRPPRNQVFMERGLLQLNPGNEKLGIGASAKIY